MFSNQITISIKDLTKIYEIYESPLDRLKQFFLPRLQKLFGKPESIYFSKFSALTNVSFEVKKGETVGIIGRNGGGKSTLLQMIVGTLTPTNGSVEVNGRVAALLELGAGFNSEFSGRDNVFMNGMLLGLTEEEIEARYEDIVKFADIGQFINQPVKLYSSGMFVRLAFAIAANVEPDILIIDEALAVGDIAFQAKCMGRLRELTLLGTTILFVSHDMGSVRNICDKVLWLKKGHSIAFGDPKTVVESYIRDLHLDINREIGGVDDVSFKKKNAPEEIDKLISIPFAQDYRRYGDGRVTILNVDLIDVNGNHMEVLDLHQKYRIVIGLKANDDIEKPALGYSFRDLKGNYVVANLTSNFSRFKMPSFKKGKTYSFIIDGVNNLAQGPYTLSVGVESILHLNVTHQFLDVLENVRVFRTTFGHHPECIFPGMVWQDVEISMIESD